jgi:phage-related protein
MEQLRIRNVHAHEPLVKKVASDLWELREESGTNIYRSIYFFFTGQRIVFLHGFQKKSQKTPRRELEEARRYYGDFLVQQERRNTP